MALIRTGGGVTDIRGGFGGVYFHRDKSGLHSAAKPRNITQATLLQRRQRGSFSKSRAFSKVNRTVSYNIYRANLGLPMKEPPVDYYPDMR
ncbi:hypothetical protein ES703_66021 [subsurface metagenome]